MVVKINGLCYSFKKCHDTKMSDEVGDRRCCAGKASWTGFMMDGADVDPVSFTSNASRTILLRNSCQSLGIQLLLRDCIFDQQYKQTYNDEDIMNISPIAKYLNPRVSDAYRSSRHIRL